MKMMTLRDLLDQVTIEGEIKVTTYDYDKEKYHDHYNGNGLWYSNVADAIDREIKYLYCQDGQLIIELEEE